MPDMLRLLAFTATISLVLIGTVAAQSAAKAAPDPRFSAQNAILLAENGHCAQALPALKKSTSQSQDRDLRRKVAMDGVRCAMTLHDSDGALVFLRILEREFPRDPDVLYVEIHAYSDLSTLVSQELARDAPTSYQAHELLAEAFEAQGKWEDAGKEYHAILKLQPHLPGIHFRIGRLLLSAPNPPADVAEQAKKEFQQELAIDPSNAGAEYVLGELAREAQQWDDAIQHFTRAAKLDSGFGDAFLGWGSALISTKKFSDAVPPLETAVKLEPQNPSAHYNLAVAYTRVGRKQEADHEFAVHRQMVEKNPPEQGDAGTAAQPANAPQ